MTSQLRTKKGTPRDNFFQMGKTGGVKIKSMEDVTPPTPTPRSAEIRSIHEFFRLIDIICSSLLHDGHVHCTIRNFQDWLRL